MEITKGKLYVSLIELIEHYEFGISPKTRRLVTLDQRIPTGTILFCTNTKRHPYSNEYLLCDFLLQNHKTVTINILLYNLPWTLQEIQNIPSQFL